MMVMLFLMTAALQPTTMVNLLTVALVLMTIKIFMNRKSILMTMLLFEMMSMINVSMALLSTTYMTGGFFMAMFTLAVCEAVVALSLMIFTSRSKSTEMTKI